MAFPPQHIPHSSRHGPPCPWIPIPDQRIICIEHPAIIQNIDKGIATLGGEKALVKVPTSIIQPPTHTLPVKLTEPVYNPARIDERQLRPDAALPPGRPHAAADPVAHSPE